MSFRVTPQTFISQLLQGAQSHEQRLAQLQQQLSTGLRIQKPSDDPVGMRSLLAKKTSDARFDIQLSNIEEGRSRLNLSVSQLLQANSIFVRAKDIALQGNQTEETEILAREVDTLIQSLLEIANAQVDGRYLYSGSAVDTAPFAVVSQDDQGNPTQILYSGSHDRAGVAIGTELTVDTLYTGAEIFRAGVRQPTIFFGSTGAAAGQGTDSAIGHGALLVRHTSTSYAPGSGVTAGLSAPADDTVIGPAGAHVLTVDDTSGTGAFGTISLNGGPPVAFTNTDTDLQVTGLGGHVVYVDATSITAGFSGTVDITATGTLSVDGGVTEIPIDFTANQTVTDSVTGAVTHVDSTNVRQAGTDSIEYPGTADAFGALVQLRDDLRNTRNLSPSDWHEAIARRIEDVDRVRDGILQVVGEQSVALENLDALQNRAEGLQLETRRQISQLESADITEVVIQLQNEQNLLQFTFATSAGLLDQSLLDFLR